MAPDSSSACMPRSHNRSGDDRFLGGVIGQLICLCPRCPLRVKEQTVSAVYCMTTDLYLAAGCRQRKVPPDINNT